MFWDYGSYTNWLRDKNEIENLAFSKIENLMKLKTLIVKTVDKIVDPNNNEK